MSDNNGNTPTKGAGDAMPAADVTFLVECLKHTTSGSISVDLKAVADELGYKNHRSVSNKLTLLKKKYQLPIGTSGANAKATGNSNGNGNTIVDPTGPQTPTKNRVAKPRASSGRKKAEPPVSRSTKAKREKEMDRKKNEEGDASEAEESDEPMDGNEQRRMTDEELFGLYPNLQQNHDEDEI